MSELRRRDLSGIYIFDTFPNEERRKPTCIEDCQQETRRKWCLSKSEDYLRQTISMLAESFKELCDYLESEKCLTNYQHTQLAIMMADEVKNSQADLSMIELSERVDTICRQLVMLADHCGVTKHIAEES
jgi:hypothetical protein